MNPGSEPLKAGSPAVPTATPPPTPRARHRGAWAFAALLGMHGGIDGGIHAARAAPVGFLCVNPGSAAAWTITVDFDRATADGFPAHITQHAVSWHDTAKGGYYELDRTTGALTVRFASSTGGYFLHDVCRPEP